MYGADGETRTLTAEATAPSRLRVYQFHHIRKRFNQEYRLVAAALLQAHQNPLVELLVAQ